LDGIVDSNIWTFATNFGWGTTRHKSNWSGQLATTNGIKENVDASLS
jgi:hypothetical protein